MTDPRSRGLFFTGVAAPSSFDVVHQAQQQEAYRRMLRIRRFEEEGTRLFKQGKILGAYDSSIGHEATIVGACLALRQDASVAGSKLIGNMDPLRLRLLERAHATFLAKPGPWFAGSLGEMRPNSRL